MPTTQAMLTVVAAIGDLTNVDRHNDTVHGGRRRETVAEHSYILATFGCALAAELDASLDLGKVAHFALVHDLPEAFMEEGDISVYAPQELLAQKQQLEAAAFEELRQRTATMPWIAQTLDAYEAQVAPEARFIYALDKMIVHMVVLVNDHHHARPRLARYLETETVARQKIERSYPGLLGFFDELCAEFKARPHLFSQG